MPKKINFSFALKKLIQKINTNADREIKEAIQNEMNEKDLDFSDYKVDINNNFFVKDIKE